MYVQAFSERLSGLIALGGPVIAILLLLSVTVVAVVLFKLWQFRVLGVGRHSAIRNAMSAWDAGQTARAAALLDQSPSHLAPVLSTALEGGVALRSRLIAMAEARLEQVERGFRLLDSIAQTAPLLGLFGTVLGMINAFQALQSAGQAVDPSILAGGIWVALLTTAAGLAVAMPTSLALTWFEARAARDRALADLALESLFHPMRSATASQSETMPQADRPASEMAHVPS